MNRSTATQAREPTSMSSNKPRKLYSLFAPVASRKKRPEAEDEWEVSLASLAEQERSQANARRWSVEESSGVRPKRQRQDNGTSHHLVSGTVTETERDICNGSVTSEQGENEATKTAAAFVCPPNEEEKPSTPEKTSKFVRGHFIKPSTLRSSTNVVLQLIHRSATIGRGKRTNRLHPPRPCWTISSSVLLDSRTSAVSCFAWDSLGVLLAVATSQKQIRIFDWDVVVAADMKHRRLRARQCDGSRPHRIPPCWTFSVPYAVSYICWNPFHPDQLAVAFRTTSHVRVFDVASVAETVNSGGAPPTTTWLGLKAPSNVAATRGARCLLFLPQCHLLVSHTDGHLVLWKIPKDTTSDVRQPLWTVQLKEDISAMVSLSSDFVLLGGTNGTITLVNWRKCTRKAFSTQVTPTIVGQWDTYQLIKMPSLSLPSCTWMGVQRFHVERNSRSSSRTTSTTWATQKLTWVTSCGWVLSMQLLDPQNRTTCPRVTVLQTSPEVRLQRADGEELETKTTLYSLPTDVAPADAISNCLCWRQVPGTIRVLPHHDKRVLDTSLAVQTVSAAETTGLLWMDLANNVTTTIRLHKNYGSPQVLAVHPSQEWIVFACNNKVRILSNRAS